MIFRIRFAVIACWFPGFGFELLVITVSFAYIRTQTILIMLLNSLSISSQSFNSCLVINSVYICWIIIIRVKGELSCFFVYFEFRGWSAVFSYNSVIKYIRFPVLSKIFDRFIRLTESKVFNKNLNNLGGGLNVIKRK